MGEVAGESHDVRASESAQGSNGVNEGDASGGGSAAKEEGGEGPEGPDGSPDEASGEENDGKREDRIADGGAGNEGQCGSNETRTEVPLTLSAAVGAASDEKHGDDGQTIRDCGESNDLEVTGMGEVLDDIGQPQSERVKGHRHGEIDGREKPDGSAPEGSGKVSGGGRRRVRLDLGDEPLALGDRQPLSFFGVVGDNEEDNDAENDRRQALADEKPLPSGKMSKAVEAQEQRGDGSTDDSGCRSGGDKEGEGAGALRGGKPAREAEDDSREESGLGCAEEKADEVEAGGRMDERHR